MPPRISKEEYERRFRELSAKLDDPVAIARTEAKLMERIDRRIRAETRARNIALKNRKLRIIGAHATTT